MCPRCRNAILMLAAVSVLAGGAHDADAQVSVHDEDGIYRVVATFTVSQTAVAARAVLTDYERIPEFMANIRTSTVLERRDGGALVEQEAVARFLFFSRRVHLVLDVQEQGGTIAFRDRCGRSFVRYEGLWTVTEEHGRTAITYELIAKPSFDVPGFLLKRLLERDASRMIEALQAAIAARAGGPPSGSAQMPVTSLDRSGPGMPRS